MYVFNSPLLSSCFCFHNWRKLPIRKFPLWSPKTRTQRRETSECLVIKQPQPSIYHLGIDDPANGMLIFEVHACPGHTLYGHCQHHSLSYTFIFLFLFHHFFHHFPFLLLTSFFQHVYIFSKVIDKFNWPGRLSLHKPFMGWFYVLHTEGKLRSTIFHEDTLF